MLWTINFITLLQLQCNSKYKLDVFHRGISSSSLSDSEPCMKSGRWQAALPMACDQRPHMLAGYLVALPTAQLLTILLVVYCILPYRPLKQHILGALHFEMLTLMLFDASYCTVHIA